MILYILVINFFAYILMWTDKLKSIHNWWRISEKTLWTIAILGGVFGIWLGMTHPLYHKIKKPLFRIGIPIIAVIWSGILIWIL